MYPSNDRLHCIGKAGYNTMGYLWNGLLVLITLPCLPPICVYQCYIESKIKKAEERLKIYKKEQEELEKEIRERDPVKLAEYNRQQEKSRRERQEYNRQIEKQEKIGWKNVKKKECGNKKKKKECSKKEFVKMKEENLKKHTEKFKKKKLVKMKEENLKKKNKEE